jgi:RNA 3'-terminal phosphate cyclase-like protein
LPKQDQLIKRIRGNAVVSKVSIDYANKMISKLREIFNDFIPDVWIYSDQVKNGQD